MTNTWRERETVSRKGRKGLAEAAKKRGAGDLKRYVNFAVFQVENNATGQDENKRKCRQCH